MMEIPRNWIGESDRAVSPVIGVILMVAITVILAAVIGTFVLELGQGAGEKAPDISMTFSDHDDPYKATSSDGDGLFTMNVRGLSATVETQDIELVVIEADGTQHVFMGQDAGGAKAGAGSAVDTMVLLINGDSNWDQTTEIDVGDRLIIEADGDVGLSDDTDYTIQVRYIGGDEPKVVNEATIRLK